MQKNNNHEVRYIPSGARIHDYRIPPRPRNTKMGKNCNTPSSTGSGMKNTSDHIQTVESVPINCESREQKNNQQSTTQKSKTPPKTICKNRSLDCENYNFKINENAELDRDIGNFSIINGIHIYSERFAETPNLHTAMENTNQNNTMNTIEDQEPTTSNLCSEKCSVVNFNEPSKVPLINSCDEVSKTEINNPTSPRSKVYDQLIKKLKIKKEKTDNFSSVTAELNTQKCPLSIQNGKKCDCESCDDFINCKTWCRNNLKFDYENQINKKRLPLFKSSLMEKQSSIVKKFSNKILLHGNLIPSPVFSIDETCVDEKIQNALRELNCTSAKDVQSYMWPAVQRGLSVFMVGPPKSGKTLAYLPAFCSFCIEKKERYYDLSKYEGPLILILCSNIEDCHELINTAKSMISHCPDDVVIKILREDSSVQIKCDMLITVPPVLEKAVKAGTVKLKRLCHLAIENAHCLLKSHSHSMKKLFQVMDQLQTNRPHSRNIQLVVNSERWSVDLETILKHLHVTPLVCFEDFLEAAVYSRIQFNKKKVKSLHKCFCLTDLLKTKYMTHKTVVFCDENDILNVSEHLQISGIECITISNHLTEDEIFENEDVWNFLQTGHYKVLLCTDGVFEKTVHILNAQWLIHYCFPTDAAQFSKRFRSISANLDSPLDDEENVNQARSKCSFVIIDELCDSQLLLDFFQVLSLNFIKHLQL